MASERFLKLLDEMRDIHERKNAGYAGKDTEDPWANFRMSEAFGVSPFKGCLVRMSDKFIRVANLSLDEENDQVGESITDTLIDLANYALIAICLYEEKEDVEEYLYSFNADEFAQRMLEIRNQLNDTNWGRIKKNLEDALKGIKNT